eukprot:scaffold7328_cov314-Pinguiococcus_pyrenoidosus.AAC.55
MIVLILLVAEEETRAEDERKDDFQVLQHEEGHGEHENLSDDSEQAPTQALLGRPQMHDVLRGRDHGVATPRHGLGLVALEELQLIQVVL